MADRPRTYMALLLVLETAMIGVFVSLDLFLFYIFWEAVLVPAYFLIGSFGGPRPGYAPGQFFVSTPARGPLLLVGIIPPFFVQPKATRRAALYYEAPVRFDKWPAPPRPLFP